MKRLSIISLYAAVLALCLMTVSCSGDAAEEKYIDSDTSVVEVTKHGIDYRGGEVTFDVKSNTYWVIKYDEENVEWLTVSPIAASGDATVTVKVKENTAAARSAKLKLETSGDASIEITVAQGASDEMLDYYTESFGEGIAEDTPIIRFDKWNKDGFGAEMVSYTGEGFVSAENPSTGYEGASGGNNISFREDGQDLIVHEIMTQGNSFFNLSFGYYNQPTKGMASGMSVMASNDGKSWFKFLANTEAGEGWHLSSTNFRVYDLDRLFLRFVGTAGSALDDIVLSECTEAECTYDLVLGDDGDDNRKVGYVYYQDDFSWVTYQFGGTDYIANPSVNTAETRFDVIYTLSPELITIFESTGWKMENVSEPVYLRLNYIKLGKANTRGTVISPALSSIREGKTVNATLSFKAVQYKSATGVNDLSGIRIEVVGDGTINSATQKDLDILLDEYDAWPNMETTVKLYNINSNTQLRFKSSYSSKYLSDNAKSNRFFLRDIKVAKMAKNTEIKEEWSTPLSAPVLKPETIDASAKEIVVAWDPVENANAYEFKALDAETGVETSTGTVTDCQCMAKGLTPDRTYKIYVRSLSTELHCYATSEWSEPVSGTTDSSKLFPAGFVFFFDDFSWLNTEFNPAWNTSDTEARVVDGGSLSLEGHGYSIPSTTTAGDSNRIYARPGLLKYGRGANAAGCNGEMFLPETMFEQIPAGMEVDITFNVLTCRYGSDTNEICVGITTNGVETVYTHESVTSSTAPNDKSWDDTFSIDTTVNCDTTIRIFTDKGNGVAAARHFIDNIKITKR